MTYSQKLRDIRWQRKRLKILERDGWKCQSCGSSDKNIQVHLLHYAKLDPWDYPDNACQTLCDECKQERWKIIDAAVERLRVDIRFVPTKTLQFIFDSFFISLSDGGDL